MNRNFWLFLLVSIIVSCGTTKVEKSPDIAQVKVSLIDQLQKKCSVLDDKWTDLMKTFECITEINHHVLSYLGQGNSPEALKLAHFGYSIFPYDGRLKTSYEKSLEVFTIVTKKMLEEPKVNCGVIKERAALLAIVSPDSTLNTAGHCLQVSQEVRVFTKTEAVEQLKKSHISEIKPELEKQVNESVSQMLKYQIAKNNESHFREILFSNIDAWSGLKFNSTNFKLGKNTLSENKFDLEVSFESHFNHRLEASCRELSKTLTFENGHDMWCYKKRDYYPDEFRYKLKLGTKDYESFTQSAASPYLFNTFPLLFVFRLEFKSAHSKKTFYYILGEEKSSRRFNYSLELLWNGWSGHSADVPDIIKISPNSPNVHVTLPYREEVTSGGIVHLNFKDLNAEAYGEMISAEFIFEPELTYNLYKDSIEKNISPLKVDLSKYIIP